MVQLKSRLVEIRQQILPGGKLAQACDYALGQWSRLEEYLSDGLLEIDNNWCEGVTQSLALRSLSRDARNAEKRSRSAPNDNSAAGSCRGFLGIIGSLRGRPIAARIRSRTDVGAASALLGV
jgi:Transposase IS66 family